MVGWTGKIEGWLDRYKNVWIDRKMNGWLDGQKRQMDGWMYCKKQMDGWKDG